MLALEVAKLVEHGVDFSGLLCARGDTEKERKRETGRDGTSMGDDESVGCFAVLKKNEGRFRDDDAEGMMMMIESSSSWRENDIPVLRSCGSIRDGCPSSHGSQTRFDRTRP